MAAMMLMHTAIIKTKLVNFRSDTIELQMRENDIFLVSVKYILVCRASALTVLSHMTHYHVSYLPEVNSSCTIMF